MTEYVADRFERCGQDGAFAGGGHADGGAAHSGSGERGVLVCFAPDGTKLSLPCARVPRPEGRRVLLFGALGEAPPYVRIDGAISAPDGKAALILPPDDARVAEARLRFEKIFKKST